jgi:hypothetical protein
VCASHDGGAAGLGRPVHAVERDEEFELVATVDVVVQRRAA